MEKKKKAFGLWDGVFLGIGSMVGAGIFIVIGEAGAIAGNMVLFSFLIAGLIAVVCGYSLAKLATVYPSRGGIIEYLVQIYGKNVFSGSLGILFYLSQLVAIAAVAKSFGTYAATYMGSDVAQGYVDIFSVGVLLLFVIVNLTGSSLVAKSESIIVIVKLAALVIFTFAALYFVKMEYLLPAHENVGAKEIFFTLGLTFFAFQGFSVITNSVEDMQNPQKNIIKSMMISIGIVTVLYLLVTVAVLGNLPLEKVIESKDFALAEAAKPAFGELGFKIIAATALLATASAINATLYSVTQISYTLAKEGDLPKIYEHNIFNNTEGLIVSALLIVPMLLFMNLSEIASLAAVAVLLIQCFVHVGHLLKRKKTGASMFVISLAAFGTLSAAAFAIYHTQQSNEMFGLYVVLFFVFSFVVEVALRLITQREIHHQIKK